MALVAEARAADARGATYSLSNVSLTRDRTLIVWPPDDASNTHGVSGVSIGIRWLGAQALPRMWLPGAALLWSSAPLSALIERLFGLSYERPARALWEYLQVLHPLLMAQTRRRWRFYASRWLTVDDAARPVMSPL